MDIWSVEIKLESLSTLGVCKRIKKKHNKTSIGVNEHGVAQYNSLKEDIHIQRVCRAIYEPLSMTRG